MFLREAIDACKAAGLHTAVETSGFGSRQAIDAAARADLILFDLKFADDERHRHYTGVSNKTILENFADLAARHPAVRVRVPVIPGVNDDRQNLMAIGELARARGIKQIDLLPYHTAGIAKYDRLGRAYALPDVVAQPVAALEPARRQLQTLGLTVPCLGRRAVSDSGR